MMTNTTKSSFLNVGLRLIQVAALSPSKIAIAEPIGHGSRAPRDIHGHRLYKMTSFGELSDRALRMAGHLHDAGLKQGMKIVLMVRPGADFVALVYALFLSGAVVVMIDPGMGLKKMIDCLSQVQPDGFIAISPVHALRVFNRSRFPNARFNVTVGKRWFWRGMSLSQIDAPSVHHYTAMTSPVDPAAIIFTSGSTGPAKGVLYTHKIIDAQVSEIGNHFNLNGTGGVDLAGFPFFGLYDAAMGTTMVVPDMDTTHPASVDPELFVEIANEWKITQAFASPALWNKVVQWGTENKKRIPTLRCALSSGAPFPVSLLPDFLQMISPDGDVFTPYGATESLPIAEIGAKEILSDTAKQTKKGRGVCVGKRFNQIRWRIIPITDSPISSMEMIEDYPQDAIGELVVTGPQVTERYVTSLEANSLSKIQDQDGAIWHRVGDLGWIDDQDRFWFCGRKAHRVQTAQNELFFSVPVESIFNLHPQVARSALAGAPDIESPQNQIPVVFIEPKRWLTSRIDQEKLIRELRELALTSPVTEKIQNFRLLRSFPVDVRHNAKINRELLSRNLAHTELHRRKWQNND